MARPATIAGGRGVRRACHSASGTTTVSATTKATKVHTNGLVGRDTFMEMLSPALKATPVDCGEPLELMMRDACLPSMDKGSLSSAPSCGAVICKSLSLSSRAMKKKRVG